MSNNIGLFLHNSRYKFAKEVTLLPPEAKKGMPALTPKTNPKTVALGKGSGQVRVDIVGDTMIPETNKIQTNPITDQQTNELNKSVGSEMPNVRKDSLNPIKPPTSPANLKPAVLKTPKLLRIIK